MPCGKGHVDLELPIRNTREINIPKEPPALEHERKEIQAALRNPIKQQPISSLVGPQDNVAIIVDDITRPTPTHKIVSAILNELKTTHERITIIVATGLHRKNSKKELETMVGCDILDKVKVVNHDAFKKKGLAHIGETSRGTKLEINRSVRDADRIIATGHIEPHEFAGFTGGRKSILPGVSGFSSINCNHGVENLDHPKAKIGILEGNPVHDDMVEAAKMVGLDFIVNVILNTKKEITKVVAGDFLEAHLGGVEFYRKHHEIEIDRPADIVITSSGYPGDINFYQSIKSIIASEPYVKLAGTIVLLAECRKGFGARSFYEFMTTISSPNEIIDRIRKEGYCADVDHAYLLGRILENNEIIVVSPHQSVHKIKNSLIKTFKSPKEAVEAALRKEGKNATIATVPYAQRIIPKS